MSSGNGQVDLRRVRIDPSKLKLRELGEIEKRLGRKLSAEFASGELGMDTMQALLWVELRRQDPAFTFEQAGEYDFNTLSSLAATDDEGQEPDPTPAPPSGQPSSA